MLAAAFLVVVQVASVSDVVSPRPDGWVADQAGVLDAGAEAQLDTIAGGLFRARGIELAVVTVDDVPGTPKQFATALFNHWGIGSARTNTGVLVLLVMGQHRLEVETGDGIEAALPASWLADMQQQDMVPHFKRGEFAGGLIAGVQAIADHLGAAPGESDSTAPPGEYRSDGTVVPAQAGGGATPLPVPVAQPDVVTAPGDSGDDSDGGPPIGALVAGGLGLVGAGGGGALFVRNRRKQRMCWVCQPPRKMLALDEVADDARLDKGQRTEEQVGSVDYEVLICPGCQASRTLRHGKWFSGYGTCSGCGYRTMKSSSTTLVEATYTHGGEVQVTETCINCDKVSSHTRYTSARTPPSTSYSSGSSGGSSYSSSSSGGSGFGGGHSSGGGAGSSW